MTIRILLADDHGVLRAGLRSLLNAEPDMDVIGEAADGNEALRLAEKLRPDVMLLDINMPGPTGIDVTQELKRSQPQIAVLILTVHEDYSLLQEAVRVGAAGYIIKRAVESELINAIHSVASGDLYVHPAMTRALLQDLPSAESQAAGSLKMLTRREIEVLRLIAQGNTNRQIADALCLSVRTVESHRSNIMGKLALNTRVELVHYAMEHGLLEETPGA
jgi:two-component system, NarL family, response regulator NreC